MRIKFFKYGYKGGWELNFIGKTYNVRIARYQFAIWKCSKPLVFKSW